MERNKILLDQVLLEFGHTLDNDFGFLTLDSEKGRWFELSWEEFRSAVEEKGGKFDTCSRDDWQEFFEIQKGKVQKLLQEIS